MSPKPERPMAISGRPSAPPGDGPPLVGAGRFTPGGRPGRTGHGVFVRSAHAHAEIAAINVSAARAAPGVLAVLTGEDARAAGLGRLRFARSLPGHTVIDPQRPILADGRVRFVGEAVVCVVAET